MLLVDRFVLAECIPLSLPYTDENSAYYKEDERSAKTDGHDADDQRREEI